MASLRHLHVLDYNGELLHKATLAGQTVASPALSGSCVYVSTLGGLQTLWFDLSDPATPVGGLGGLSSPALGCDVTVYAVLREDDRCSCGSMAEINRRSHFQDPQKAGQYLR